MSRLRPESTGDVSARAVEFVLRSKVVRRTVALGPVVELETASTRHQRHQIRATTGPGGSVSEELCRKETQSWVFRVAAEAASRPGGTSTEALVALHDRKGGVYHFGLWEG